jgi:hypothetical protein
MSIQLEGEADTGEGGTTESSVSSVNGAETGGEPGTGVKSKASGVAAARGLNVNVTPNMNRHSKPPVGLPMSPRPPASPQPGQTGPPL